MAILTRPTLASIPLLDITCSLNLGQKVWLFGADGAGSAVRNIADSTRNGTLQSGATHGGTRVGRGTNFDGGASSYIDMGANIIQSSENVTMSWIEVAAAGTPNYSSTLCLFPNGGSQRFCVFREGPSYGTLAWRIGGGAMIVSSDVPTKGSGIGIARHFVLRGRNGIQSVTASDWDVWVDGVKYTQAAGNSLGSQTSQLNYWGWDGTTDPKWLGSQTNQRLWNRALTDGEVDLLNKNPYAGIWNDELIFQPGAAAPPPPAPAAQHRMLLAF